MYRINKPIKTREEKVAERIGVIVSDLNLDLEKVGYYLARALPHLTFSRALEILESAQFQKPILDEMREKKWDWYDDKFCK